MNSLNVDYVFVAHYAPLTQRKQVFSAELARHNIDAEWITEEPDEPLENASYYDPTSWDEKLKVVPRRGHASARLLRQAEYSLMYKHMLILFAGYTRTYDSILVLEDDAMLHPMFTQMFNKQLAETPDDYDFVFIGSGCNLRIPQGQQVPGQVAYKVPHPASKCTDSFVVSRKALEKLSETLEPFTFPADFELNYQMALHDMNVYWWEPPIVSQGSQDSTYCSEVQ